MNVENATQTGEAGEGRDRMVSPTAAAYLTGFAVVTLRAAERRGLIPGYRLLGRLRFKLSDLLAFIEAGRMAPRRAAPTELLAAGGRPPGRRRRR